MKHTDFEDVELGLVVNLSTLKDILKSLSVSGRRWWIASDPEDAAESGFISIGHGDPGCHDRLNTLHFRVPIISCVVPEYHRPRLVMLFDEAYITPEEPGVYVEDGIVMRNGLEDFRSFFVPVRKALADRLTHLTSA